MVVAAIGEVDVFTAPQLDAELTRLTHEGRTSIVVDLSRVDFLDSTGLSVLVKALKRVRESEGSLDVVVTVDRVAEGVPAHRSRPAHPAARHRRRRPRELTCPPRRCRSRRRSSTSARRGSWRSRRPVAPGSTRRRSTTCGSRWARRSPARCCATAPPSSPSRSTSWSATTAGRSRSRCTTVSDPDLGDEDDGVALALSRRWPPRSPTARGPLTLTWPRPTPRVGVVRRPATMTAVAATTRRSGRPARCDARRNRSRGGRAWPRSQPCVDSGELEGPQRTALTAGPLRTPRSIDVRVVDRRAERRDRLGREPHPRLRRGARRRRRARGRLGSRSRGPRRRRGHREDAGDRRSGPGGRRGVPLAPVPHPRVFAALVFFLLFLLPAETTSEKIGRSVFFLVGAVFSAITGYVGMWLAVRGNVRVAAAANESRRAARR